jgi:hypothetical protein
VDVTIGTATAAYKQLVLSTSRKVLQQKRELRVTVNTRRRLLETCLKRRLASFRQSTCHSSRLTVIANARAHASSAIPPIPIARAAAAPLLFMYFCGFTLFPVSFSLFSQPDLAPCTVLLHVAAECLLAGQLVATQRQLNQRHRLPELHRDLT